MPEKQRRDVQEVSSNPKSPKSNFAGKVYSEVLFVHPGALKHGRFGI